MIVDFFDVDRRVYEDTIGSFLNDDLTKEVKVLFTSFVGLKSFSKLKGYCKVIVEYTADDLGEIPELFNQKNAHYVVKRGEIDQLKSVLKQIEVVASDMSEETDLAFLFFRLSHDLRSPLASIEGLVELLKNEEDKAARDVYNNMILKSSKRLEMSLSKILDMANFKRGESLEFQEVNFRDLLDKVMSNLRFLDGFSKIDFQINEEINAVLNTDPVLLESLLQNLVQNAVKYMNFNQIEPKVLIDYHINTNKVSFVVRDNGVGVTKKARKNLFDMFYRGQSDVPGSGLGLFIAKRISAKLNGSISVVDGVNGVGLGFEVTFENIK